jgi:hypothetical protein
MDTIDLLKISIPEPPNAKINYINELLDTTVFSMKPNNLIFFGFGGLSGSVAKFDAQKSRVNCSYNFNGYKEVDSALTANIPNMPEAEHKKFWHMTRFYYFAKPVAEHGYSGSPVFGEFKKGKKVFYRFMGVVFAQPPYIEQTWIIRGDVAYKYLFNLSFY